MTKEEYKRYADFLLDIWKPKRGCSFRGILSIKMYKTEPDPTLLFRIKLYHPQQKTHIVAVYKKQTDYENWEHFKKINMI